MNIMLLKHVFQEAIRYYELKPLEFHVDNGGRTISGAPLNVGNFGKIKPEVKIGDMSE